MDKYEFNIKVEQIKKMVNKGDFTTAMKIADTIDWRRARNANLLSMISQVYEENGEYQEAKEILLQAYERAPVGKRLLYKLAELALREGNVREAEDYYREFCEVAPGDSRRNLLRYLILKAKGASTRQLIPILESYIATPELDEQWMYRLAEMYAAVNEQEKCIQMCDRITLMFAVGKYVDKAIALKMKYTKLSAYQQDLVENPDKYEAKLKAVEQEFADGVLNVFDDDAGNGANMVMQYPDNDTYSQDSYGQDHYAQDEYAQGGYSRDGYEQNGYARGDYEQGGYAQDNYGQGDYAQDGYEQGGYAQDGYEQGDYAQDNYGQDGYAQGNYEQGEYVQGDYEQGDYAQDGYEQNGYAQDNYEQGGYTQGDYGQGDYTQDGYEQSGDAQNHYEQNDYVQDGYSQDGYEQNGYAQDGYAQDSYEQNGYAQDGYAQGDYVQNDSQGSYAREDDSQDSHGQGDARIDEALIANLREAEQQKKLAREMSRISSEGFTEKDVPAEHTKKLYDIHRALTPVLHPEADGAQIVDDETQETAAADQDDISRTGEPETAAAAEGNQPENSPEPEKAAPKEAVFMDRSIFAMSDAEEESSVSRYIVIETRTPEKGFQMAVKRLKEYHARNASHNQTVRIKGGKLSRRGVDNLAEKLAGKDIIIDEAGDLAEKDLAGLVNLAEGSEDHMVIVLLDNPRQVSELYHRNSELLQTFEHIDGEKDPEGEQAEGSEPQKAEAPQSGPEDQAGRNAAEEGAETAGQKMGQDSRENDGQNIRQDDGKTGAQHAEEGGWEFNGQNAEGGSRESSSPSADDGDWGNGSPNAAEDNRESGVQHADDDNWETGDRNGEENSWERDGQRADDDNWQNDGRNTEEDGWEAGGQEADEANWEDGGQEAGYDSDEVMEQEDQNYQREGYGVEMDPDAFAEYAAQYAAEIDCSITGTSMLALYEHVEMMEEDGIPLTKENAEAMIEEAADKAEKPSLGGLIKGVFTAKYNKEGLLILREEHFN